MVGKRVKSNKAYIGREKTFPSEKPIIDCVERYRQNPSFKNGEELLKQFDRVVTPIAHSLAENTGNCNLVQEDYVSVGNMAVLNYAVKWNGSGSIRGYISRMVRHRILDYQRDNSPIRRWGVKWIVAIRKYEDKFLRDNQRKPSDEEICNSIGISEDTLSKARRNYSLQFPLGLEVKLESGDTFKLPLKNSRDESQLDETRLREYLLDAFEKGKMSREERLVLMLYYSEDLTQPEIGKAVGISPSRVSQIHSNLLKRLKAVLSNDCPTSSRKIK